MDRFRTFWWCFALITSSRGFPDRLLYNHANIGTNLPSANDISSPEVRLRVPIVFYGQVYHSIFVNSNGLLSFQTDIPTFFNIEFPLDYPVIAPLYSNVDTSKTGTISYHESSDPQLLERANRNVHEGFSYADDFQATSLFVVTWSSVGYHKNGVDKLNTFQVTIASDGDDSFVEFLYPENGIQWIQGTGDDSGLPDARAQAGFIAADGRFYLLQGSGTDQVKNLEKWSNINVPGQWLFRVGRLDQDANIEQPDMFNNELDNGEPKSCEKGAASCHAFAKCNDYSEGFCCICKQQYYGNGKFCVKRDVPLRVNGKVNGRINGEKLGNLDLQSYVVMSDGRAYTAISKIPESIGSDIQSLQVLGGVIGWLFAKPVSDSINGFQITGGTFNHTATIHFINTNQKIIIRHKYFGLDVFDQLKLEIDVQGEIPHIPLEAKINFPEYEEQFTSTVPGTILSSSSRTFGYTNLEGSEVAIPYTIEQAIVFDYCKFEAGALSGTWRLKVGRNFISYEATEQIVRYGLSAKIGPLGEADPCDIGRSTCGPNSACVVENDSYRCLCNPGYQHIYKDSSSAVCEDINECQTGLHDCDFNAQCFNEIGSYTCRCNPGFEGNGRFCQNAQTCSEVQCPENAECVEDGLAACRCIAGFTGNGQMCVPVQGQSCHIANNCSPYGYCTINPQTKLYSCVCLPGFSGDGYNCEENRDTVDPTTTEIATDEPVTPQCVFGVCWCPSGYEKQAGANYCIVNAESTTPMEVTTSETETETETEQVSRPEAQCFGLDKCFCPRGYNLDASTKSCVPKTDKNLETMGFSGFNITCNIINSCHRNAQCIYELSINNYQCVCNVGFEGDGYDCRDSDVSCTVSDVCDTHASCQYSEQLGRSACVCDSGYIGNGRTCRLTGCTSHGDCPPNEQCSYSTVSNNYECICREGLIRDSQQQCVQLTGTCGAGTCTENAECLYDDSYQTHYCACKPGYEGDGITECKPEGCDVLNNCSPHANCAYDPSLEHYQCKCNEGFQGDGLTCNVEKNCHTDPYICDPRAVCVTNSERKYVCHCQPGFVGNGTVCKESLPHEGNFLLLNQGKATLRVPFDASPKNLAKLIHIDQYQTAVGLDIDCVEGRVYWSDISGRVIKSSTYNGSDVMDFITKDIGSPEGLTIDWISRNIYWTDSTKDTIEVANLETKLRATLFNTSLVNPRGIAVHPQRGKIFWTDWDRKNPKIEWANADGTGREIFLQGPDVQLPNSLVIDFDAERLCYADAGSKKIECLDIDTRYKQTIATNCTYPFGISVTDEHIYWSDWIVKKVEHVDKRSLQRLKPLDVPLGGTNKLYGLVAVPQRCLGLNNVCQYHRHQCPADHICLPNSGSRRCVCGYVADSTQEGPSCAV